MGIPPAEVATPSRPGRQHFTVRMPEPASHLLEVELQIREVEPEVPLRLRLPVWTPGSYLVREHARHVQEFQALSEQGSPLDWRKVDKNTWEVDPPGCSAVTVRYRVYAYELTVRTNHLDLTHAYFNGAALFLYVPGREREPYTLTVIPPHPDWRIATSLRPLASPSPGILALASLSLLKTTTSWQTAQWKWACTSCARLQWKGSRTTSWSGERAP